jgi:hypothetical protein
MDILVHSKNGARPARRPSGLRLLAWVRGYGFQCRSNGNGNGNGNDEDRVYTVNGRISRVDATQGIFVIRKMLVDHRAAAFLGGASVDLAAGKVVRVEGRLSTDGTRLHATRVEFR